MFKLKKGIKRPIIFFSILLCLVKADVVAQEIFFPHPNRIKYDSYSLQIEGKDVFVYSGAFHYFRCPKQLWKDRFQKMKEAGFNSVETYVPWNYHERKMPKNLNDFSNIDLSELQEWMNMAEDFGFYIIIRPGPYICAEWDGGGFPQWLVANKKPVDYPKDEVWLQTDNPVFLAWNKHWYEAVCKVVKPHQITHKAVGQTGVILFQVENEFERINWIPKNSKRKYLEALTQYSKDGGIDVPIFTCWTRESRNVKDEPLRGVFDFMNFYPKWDIKKGMERTFVQRKEQSYAPAMSAELQGGWYSAIGDKLSSDMDFTSAEQTQNVTLYALQQGFSLINYYMLVGGTNFDDWASREATTTYDFAAAIHENGGVGEKYRRVKAIADMLKIHGTRIARAELENINVSNSDSSVEVTLRRSLVDGSRYYFVRTEDRTKSHFGTATVKETNGTEFSFDYELEPFGSMIFYLPANTNDSRQGVWFPKKESPMVRPGNLPDEISFDKIEQRADYIPRKWFTMKNNLKLEDYGITNRHFIYYQLTVESGKKLSIGRIGNKVVSGTREDGILVKVGDKLIHPIDENKDEIVYQIPAGATKATILFENRGLHHHTKLELEKNWLNGLKWIKVDDKAIPFKFASIEKERGLEYSNPQSTSDKAWKSVEIKKTADTFSNELLVWNRVQFELPESKKDIWMPWSFHLKAKGNGFVYLNGHCIGRYWEEGPQTEFFLPECWLNFGKEKKNLISFSLRPTEKGISVDEIAIIPEKKMAEFKD